jgi:hypothetical protein
MVVVETYQVRVRNSIEEVDPDPLPPGTPAAIMRSGAI